jgi:2-polyprenyl-6-methoxyphenol hydroxylase-like FAD-dependent oxidoreductase
MKVLICGAGIAGPTLAWWLTEYGIECTLVERAPGLRTGGYIIDFWGAGFDVADRMGLLPEIRAKGYLVREVRVVNRAGKRVAGFPVEVFSRVTRGRYVSVPRSELAAAIYGRLGNRVESIFSDSVARVEQSEGAVHVTFESGARRDFDLLVGADGLHSRVRELVFGPESRFEKYLGYKAAAFEVEGYQPRDELLYVMYTEVGRQVGRFAMRGGRTMFLFTFADPQPGVPDDIRAQKAMLRARFENSGWECPRILDALDGAPALYFDRVSQILMDSKPGLWTRGRVVLTGDAAWCVSLLAGQGSALAMVGAYVLAGELYRAEGDYGTAFRRYQERLAPFLHKKQKAALRFAGVFAPESKTALVLRNRILDLLRLRWMADFAFARDFRDELTLPEYRRPKF